MYCEAAPLSCLFAKLQAPLDISHARFLIDDEIVKEDFSRIPPDGSTVFINVVSGGSSSSAGKGSFWAGLGLAVLGGILMVTGYGSAFGAVLIGTGVGLMAGGVALMNLEIPVPKLGNGMDTGSQMESIRGSRNRDRRLDYVPVLFGRHLVVPDVAALPYTEIDASGQQWLTQLFCAGYGDLQVEPDSLKIGDTALTEFSQTKNITAILEGNDAKVKLEIIQNGGNPSLYPNICVEQQFNAVLKHQDDDGQPIEIIRTTADKTTRINVDIIFPQGLTYFNDDGNKTTTGVTVSIQYKAETDPDSAYQTFPDWSPGISNATVDMFRRQATVSNLEPGKYTVKIVRQTGDSHDTRLINTVYLGSIRSFADDRPVRQAAAQDLTIIAVKIRASTLATGIIDNFNFVAQSVIPDYSDDELAWVPRLTKNPALMLLYVLQGKINPAPVGDADIDWDAFREFWIFCNQKDYTCNAVQGGRELFSTLCTKIAKTGRASLLRVNGKFTVIIDRERPAPVQLFSPRNTVAYTQTIVKADIPDEVALEFIDETVGWTSNERSVYNTADGLPDGTERTKQSSRIWGITDPAVIFKFARYQYACIKNRPIIHTISCDIEYLLCRKGDLIEYAGDTALTGISYGKVTGIIRDNNKIIGIVSDSLFPQEEGKSYGIRCRKSSGLLVTLDIANLGTNDKTLIFEIPQNEGTLETGDLVVFGLTGKITRQLIISEISPEDNFRAALKCIDYAPEVYGVDDPNFVVPPFDNKITTEGGTNDAKIMNPESWQTWFSYHDAVEMPDKPTGNGTTGGWHRYLTPQSQWVSQKTAPDVSDGEWGAPTQTSFRIITDIAATRPTYREIVEGFEKSGTTLLPAPLTATAAGGLRFISVSWAKQGNLSGLKEYQVQVSEDAAAWYAPRFDGQGPAEAPWRGEENGFYATTATLVIHPNIPPAGTESDPRGRVLFYRVRQRTMLDAYSDWSDAAGAETKLTDTGDYGVNSISANALKTAELLAVFAKLTESLIGDPRYGISSENAEWADGDTRAVLNARQIAFQFFVDQVWTTMARLGLEGVEATQIYSPDKLFITNDDMLSRRSRGYDVGAPLLSDNSRVAHLDVNTEISPQGNNTYILDQHGDNFLLVTGSGSLEGEAEGIPLILKAIAPYSTETRALHGNFRLQGDFQPSGAWTLDFWLFYYWNENQIVFRAGNGTENIQLAVRNKEPYLNDEPAEECWLNDEPVDGVWFNEIKEAGTRVTHLFQGVTDEIDLENSELESEKWYHIGIIGGGSSLKLIINNRIISWASQAQTLLVNIDINPSSGAIDGEHSLMMIDEIMLDPSKAEDIALFQKNSAVKRPWGKLDDQHPWAIINVRNPSYFKTNIFQSPDFIAAVQAVISGGSS
jgi:hypothetical protein